MISENMFTRNTTISLNVGDVELTKPFVSGQHNPTTDYIDSDSTPFVNAYYLGWIRPENTPSAFKYSEYKLAMQDMGGTLSAKNSTEFANYNVMYCGYLGTQTTYQNYYSSEIINNSNSSASPTPFPSKWRAAPFSNNDTTYFGLGTRQMINKFYIGCVNFDHLQVLYAFCDLSNFSQLLYGEKLDINAEDFETWAHGTTTITHNNNTFEIDNEILNENFYQDIEAGGVTYRIFIAAYRCYMSSYIDSNGNTINDLNNFSIFPGLSVKAKGSAPYVSSYGVDYKEIIVSGRQSFYTTDYLDDATVGWSSSVMRNCYAIQSASQLPQYPGNMTYRQYAVDPDENDFYAAPNGIEFEVENYSTKTTGYTYRQWEFNGNCAICLWNGTCEIARMYTPVDIVHHMSLMPRWKAKSSDSPSYGVVSGVYYPEVLENGEFTGRLITGTVAELYQKLRPWQYDEMSTNRYSAEDLPPYTPPGPGDDRPSSIGDQNLSNVGYTAATTMEFCTMYALLPIQLARFGRALWGGIFDPLFIQAVFTTLEQDFSVNPADILKYIVSVRQYPFNFGKPPGTTPLWYSSEEKAEVIYLGVGTQGIDINSGHICYVITSYTESFGGGTLAVPRHYNDFRDYEPFTKVELYVPFCGVVELTPSEVVGHTLDLSYSVDLSSGLCTCSVHVLSEKPHIVATLSGTIGCQVELTASNEIEHISKLGSTAFNALVGCLTAQAGASYYALGSDSQIEMKDTQRSSLQQQGVSMMNSGIRQVISSPDVSGLPVHSVGTPAGFCEYKLTTPYLTVTRKYYEVPPNYSHVYGNATNITETLSEVSGFTVCNNPDLSGITATGEERSMIATFLETGIFL